MAEIDSAEKEGWADESKFNGSSTIYQDINFNQSAQSLDISQQNQTANASVLSMLKHNNNNRLYKQQKQQQQQHDTSNIDTLVTKSLEISRSYRKLNFSGMNNNSIIYEAKYLQGSQDSNNTPVISMENIKPQKSQKLPPQQKPRRTLTNSIGSSKSYDNNKVTSSNEFDVDKQNIDLQKQTDCLLREYNDIKKQQHQLMTADTSNNNFEDLVNELYQHQQPVGNSKNGSKKTSLKDDKSDHLSVKSKQSASEATNSRRKSESKSGRQSTAAANPMINEISEIMSESIYDHVNGKKKKKGKNVEDVEEEEESDNGETEDDSDDSDDDDDIEELISKNNNFQQKLSLKHESTKAYNSNDEDEDDDDDDDDNDYTND
jgi:hypothetical protein